MRNETKFRNEIIEKMLKGEFKANDLCEFRVARGREYYTIKYDATELLHGDILYSINKTYVSAKYFVHTLFCVIDSKLRILEFVNADKVIPATHEEMISILEKLDIDILIEIHNSFYDEQLTNELRTKIDFRIDVNDDLTKEDIVKEIKKIENVELIPREEYEITENKSDAVKNDYRYYEKVRAELIIEDIMKKAEYVSNKYEVIDRALYLTEDGLVVLELFNSKQNNVDTERYTISENQDISQFSKNVLLRIANSINSLIENYNESL